ncbi:hypothetical protein TNCT_99911 [Trichonephila clavata]|uniref:Uncharacterized protein n=1 Tax=Trichonephila clavata TaxID=2740835 RepID=A0A8X6EXU8_TRICU|nr:hypothetical protein TNCT_99911 [Trichonephila clavata]
MVERSLSEAPFVCDPLLLLAVPDHLWPSKKKTFLGKREKSLDLCTFSGKSWPMRKRKPRTLFKQPTVSQRVDSVKLI